MANGYTAFISYILVPSGLTDGSYSQAIHCNYIKSLQLNTDNPSIEEISMNFPNIDDFKYLSDDISNGTGYTINEIHAIVQLVDNVSYNELADIKPDSDKWKRLNITSQISGYTYGTPITPTMLTSLVFKIPFLNYASYPTYNVEYLNYPTKEETADDELCFGDESYFLGNVTTEIKAIAYTTDLSINLPLNEFNSSSNLTWDGSSVFITEIGIYDANKNLVGIGKLNNPILKDSNIARTIVYAIDF